MLGEKVFFFYVGITYFVISVRSIQIYDWGSDGKGWAGVSVIWYRANQYQFWMWKWISHRINLFVCVVPVRMTAALVIA